MNENVMYRPAFSAGDLAARLRRTDLQELGASAPDQTPAEILDEALQISHLAWAAWRLGQIQALFGVAPAVPCEVGSIWLLASDDIYNWRKEFMRASRHYVEIMHRFYPHLGNFVDNRNRTSQAWLRRLGFQPGQEIDCGGHPFTYYWSDTRV